MEITTAVLCDYAQVRFGLLFISSGLITRIFRPGLSPDNPAPLGLMLAVVVELEPTEIDRVHEIKVRVTDPDANVLEQVTAGFQSAGDLQPGETLQVPMAINAGRVPLMGYGPHDVTVSVDGQVGRTLRFYVIDQPPA